MVGTQLFSVLNRLCPWAPVGLSGVVLVLDVLDGPFINLKKRKKTFLPICSNFVYVDVPLYWAGYQHPVPFVWLVLIR